MIENHMQQSVPSTPASDRKMHLADMKLSTCPDGCHLVIQWGGRVIAIVGSMGSDVEEVEIAELGWVKVEALVGML